MKLEDLLSVTSEFTTVNVLNCANGLNIGRYDGRDSIDKRYNECQVVQQYIQNNELVVEVVV